MGHINRVECIKYDPNNPNLLYTGGWDDLLIVYDLRQKMPVTHLKGPHICGESIDVNPYDNIIVAGSYSQ